MMKRSREALRKLGNINGDGGDELHVGTMTRAKRGEKRDQGSSSETKR